MGDATRLRELYEARRLDEARELYCKMLTEGPVTTEDHLWGGMATWRMGDTRGARRAFELGWADEPIGMVRGQLCMMLGVVLREIGETCAAVDYLERFLGGMDTYPELRTVATGSGHYNLAMAYKGARRYQESITAYEVAIAEFRREGMTDYLRRALQNYAWVLCIMGDAQRAEISLTDAEELITDNQGRWQQELGWAFAEAVAGRKSEALTRCGKITANEWAPPMNVVSHAYWVAGRVTLDMGQIDAAEVMQKAALEWALKADSDSRCLQDANDLQRSIYEARLHKQTEGA